MNSDEYCDWYAFTIARFPQVEKEFSCDAATARERTRAWLEALEPVPLETGKSIVTEMHLGRIDPPRMFWDRFVGIVRREFENRRLLEFRQRDESGPRILCEHCQDTSFIEIWNPLALDAMRDDWETGRYGAYSDLRDRQTVIADWLYAWWRRRSQGPLRFAVVCRCNNRVAVAKREHARETGRNIWVFDPDKHLPYVGTGKDRYAQLTEYFENSSVLSKWDYGRIVGAAT